MGDISQGDLADHIADLHRRKAPGLDGIPYEFIRDAEPELVELYQSAVNELLSGAAIPHLQKGGLVSLLVKREPSQFIENLRPITLLTTVYKLFTSVLDSRLKREMERLGMLEDSQEGF